MRVKVTLEVTIIFYKSASHKNNEIEKLDFVIKLFSI